MEKDHNNETMYEYLGCFPDDVQTNDENAQKDAKKKNRTLIGIMKNTTFIVALLLFVGRATPVVADEPVFDIVVYGDSSGAVTAAVAAKRRGRSVILVNPTRFLGGMSASGLGATDFLGKRSTFGGIASEFYDAIAQAYGKTYVRSFEPHVGRKVFDQLIAAADVPVVFNEKLNREAGVKMDGQRIVSITTLSGKTYRGKMFIDATYVGDLMAAAGVTYTVGREAEDKYGENLAGVRRGDSVPRKHYTQGDKDHFTHAVDPYIKPGDPGSGLLPYVFKIDKLTNGQGDRKIQAYNYRVCLTTDPKLRIPIDKPEGYRSIDHELLLRNFEAGDHRVPGLIEQLAGSGSKVDWNSMHAVGSDFGGANWEYPEASYEKRREIEKAHQTYIRGFLWTLAHSPRVPEPIRKKVSAVRAAQGRIQGQQWVAVHDLHPRGPADGLRLRDDPGRLRRQTRRRRPGRARFVRHGLARGAVLRKRKGIRAPRRDDLADAPASVRNFLPLDHPTQRRM